MQDQTCYLLKESFPDGIWNEIAQYLSPEDLAKLQRLCRDLNMKLHKLDVVWQPYLNQLHAIDDDIPVVPEVGKTIRETFIEGLNKVRARQMAEIAYLCEHQDANILQAHPAIQAYQPLKLSNLAQVIAIDKALNTINQNVVKPLVAEAKTVNYKIIDLSGRSLTRLPESIFEDIENAQFWFNVKYVYIDDNFLEKIPKNICKLKAVTLISLNKNQFVSFPRTICQISSLVTFSVDDNQVTDLSGLNAELVALKVLSLKNNQLRSIPEAIGKLSALKELNLANNKIESLPDIFDGLVNLGPLDLDGNYLRKLPNSLLTRSYKDWVHKTLFSQKCNKVLIDPSQAVDIYLETNYLLSQLHLELKSKVPSTPFFDRSKNLQPSVLKPKRK